MWVSTSKSPQTVAASTKLQSQSRTSLFSRTSFLTPPSVSYRDESSSGRTHFRSTESGRGVGGVTDHVTMASALGGGYVAKEGGVSGALPLHTTDVTRLRDLLQELMMAYSIGGVSNMSQAIVYGNTSWELVEEIYVAGCVHIIHFLYSVVPAKLRLSPRECPCARIEKERVDEIGSHGWNLIIVDPLCMLNFIEWLVNSKNVYMPCLGNTTLIVKSPYWLKQIKAIRNISTRVPSQVCVLDIVCMLCSRTSCRHHTLLCMLGPSTSITEQPWSVPSGDNSTWPLVSSGKQFHCFYLTCSYSYLRLKLNTCSSLLNKVVAWNKEFAASLSRLPPFHVGGYSHPGRMAFIFRWEPVSNFHWFTPPLHIFHEASWKGVLSH